MDDNVCPLCCEELDISDQQFFPCKCGYQVCMWCWHRIRKQETGLCPACRTPYGDDPHEFSAVDVQEVLKANREKEAAAKRERDRQRQTQNHSSSDGAGGSAGLNSSSGTGGHHLNGSYAIAEDGTPLTGIMEVPKDRTQLANMRVIRRNLVYAVGLPPSIANEDVLRRPDYFGQYGKIAKIVLNRSQASNGDPRRASCSAYVTFVHKEDTLACILALDGYYLENRNVRASYGTSKYCSAFIKNVRCNNPECTYLHEMGAVEDTFTKQEIQAGYVTSGRDVLARQQQIVQQALNATSQGMAGTAPRRKIGGGGPSGTGKGASNPVFPAPEFDEPTKPAPLVPAPSNMARAASTGTGFPTVAAAAQQTLSSKPMTRSASTGTNKVAVSSTSTVQPAPRKGILASTSTDSNNPTPAQATAASVVAGVHSVSGGIGNATSSHTQLTSLTPLKRTKATTAKATTSTTDTSTLSMTTISNNYPKPQKPAAQRIGTTSKSQSETTRGTIGGAVAAPSTTATTVAAPPVAPQSPGLPTTRSVSSTATLTPLKGPEPQQHQPSSLSALGGEVIAAPDRSKIPASVGAIGSPFSGGSRSNAAVGSSALNGLDNGSDIIGGRPVGLSGLGGEVFTGPLSSPGPKSAIGSGKDKWGSSQYSSNSGAVGQPIGPPGGLWGSHVGNTNLQGISGSTVVGNPSVGIGGGVIGSHMPSHGLSNDGPFGAAPGSHNSGSNALASILGINLPTGSGSLRESPNLWPHGAMPAPQQHAPVSSLQGTPMPTMPSQGIIGRSSSGGGGLIGPIGGNPIGVGGGVVNQAGAIGNSNKNDIALLQSLLPQVHITRGSGAPQNGWNAGRAQHQQPVGVGPVGRNMPQQAQPQGAAGNLNIW